MSGVAFTCNTGEVTGITTAKTILGLLAASNHRVHIKGVIISFKGLVVTNEPVTIEFIRWSADGTGSAGTPQKVNNGDNETLQASFKYNYSAEPTTPTVLQSFSVHPQGTWGYERPIEAPIPVIGGGYWGIRITADDSITAMASIECEE